MALAVALAAAAPTAGCSRRGESRPAFSGVQEHSPPPATPRPAPRTAARPRIVALGDSLTAGLGLQADQAYPMLLQQRINEVGFDYEVVNAGVSGDTSAGGLSRLDWALEGDVRILIVALGGNDALRALPTDELKRNLSQIIERAQARHISVMLAGMEAPRNFGRDYIVAFHQVYPAVAAEHHVPLVPFLLDGVAADPALNQRDGIHPTAEGARIVADNVWAVLRPLIEQQRRGATRKEGPAGS
jgi:acyl-CoA thioesterase-1